MCPVPLFAGVFLDKGDGVADFLGRIFLYVVLSVAQRRGQLEHRDAVLLLQALGDQTVAHERAVAGRVALDGAASEHGRVVVDGDTGLRLGHGADVTGKAVFLRDVDVVQRRALVQKHGDIGRGDLAAEGHDGREAHHHGLHLVLIHQHDLFGELLIVADAAVAAEQLVQQLCDIFHDQVLLGMADAQMLIAQALGMAVDHHRDRQIARHPAIAEQGFDVPGLHEHDTEHGKPVVEPAGEVVGCVPDTAPLTAVSHPAGRIEPAEVLGSDSVFVFHHEPP